MSHKDAVLSTMDFLRSIMLLLLVASCFFWFLPLFGATEPLQIAICCGTSVVLWIVAGCLFLRIKKLAEEL